jgi:hypothetical protein
MLDFGFWTRAACATGTAWGLGAGAGLMAGSTVVVNPILQRLNHESTKRRSARHENNESREKSPANCLRNPQSAVQNPQ